MNGCVCVQREQEGVHTLTRSTHTHTHACTYTQVDHACWGGWGGHVMQRELGRGSWKFVIIPFMNAFCHMYE